MKIDTNELQAVAIAGEVAAPAPRVDLYAGIHKALRALMADTLLALGRMDPDDGLDLAEATDRVLFLLQTCADHLAHENEFVHPALEARAAGSSERIAHEHGDHLAQIAELGQAVASLRAAPAAAKSRAPRRPRFARCDGRTFHFHGAKHDGGTSEGIFRRRHQTCADACRKS